MGCSSLVISLVVIVRGGGDLSAELPCYSSRASQSSWRFHSVFFQSFIIKSVSAGQIIYVPPAAKRYLINNGIRYNKEYIYTYLINN